MILGGKAADSDPRTRGEGGSESREQSAKIEIRSQILAAKENPAKVESPISIAIDFEALNRSKDPAKRDLADILRTLAELKSMIDSRLPADFAIRDDPRRIRDLLMHRDEQIEVYQKKIKDILETLEAHSDKLFQVREEMHKPKV